LRDFLDNLGALDRAVMVLYMEPSRSRAALAEREPATQL
jgi:hypothetical protein